MMKNTAGTGSNGGPGTDKFTIGTTSSLQSDSEITKVRDPKATLCIFSTPKLFQPVTNLLPSHSRHSLSLPHNH